MNTCHNGGHPEREPIFPTSRRGCVSVLSHREYFARMFILDSH
jgi:hypothetical protein